MKPYLPGFLRKKMRSSSSSSSFFFKDMRSSSSSSSSSFLKNMRSSSSSSSSSLKNLDSLQAMVTLDSSSPGLLENNNGRNFLSLKDAFAPAVVRRIKDSVRSRSATGKVKSQFASKLPSRNPNHELEEAFLHFDANRDGKISTLELGAVLRSLGDNPSDEELLLMVKEADRDGDGFIDLQEFILLNSECSSSGKEDLHQAFLVFDGDANGKISVEELHHVLNRLGESCTLEECSRMIRGVDMDGDGFVDFQEFCTMMTMQ